MLYIHQIAPFPLYEVVFSLAVFRFGRPGIIRTPDPFGKGAKQYQCMHPVGAAGSKQGAHIPTLGKAENGCPF